MWLPHYQVFKELLLKNMQSPYWQTEVLPEVLLNFQIVVILCVQFLGTSVHVKLYVC